MSNEDSSFIASLHHSKSHFVSKLSYSIGPWSQYSVEDFPQFTKPRRIGEVSVTKTSDGRRSVTCDDSKLSVLQAPKSTSLDLNDGFNLADLQDEVNNCDCDDILHWLNTQIEGGIELPPADVICYRGALTKLLTMHTENREDYAFAVICLNGTLFVWNATTEKKYMSEVHRSHSDKKFCFWGRRFEQYMTGTGKDHGEYGLVSMARLVDLNLLYLAEVDCCRNFCRKDKGESSFQNCEFVELKTNRLWNGARQQNNWQLYKLPKVWSQSFLVNVQSVVFGFRDDSGVVRSSDVKEYTLRELGRLARSADNTKWNPNLGFQFVYSFLSHLRSLKTQFAADKVYLYYWGGTHSQDMLCTVHDVNSRYYFIPRWFQKSWNSRNDCK